MNLNKEECMEENNNIINRRNLNKKDIENNNNDRRSICKNSNKTKTKIKTKNIMILLAILLLIVMCIILIPKKKMESRNEKESKDTIENFLEEIKKDEAIAIAKYGQTDLEKEINKAKYKYMTYKVEEIKKQGNKPLRYDVIVKIYNVDVNAAINETENEMKSVQDKNEYTKKYIQIFNKKLSEKKKDKKEETIRFNLIYDDMAKKYVVNNAETMKYLRKIN